MEDHLRNDLCFSSYIKKHHASGEHVMLASRFVVVCRSFVCGLLSFPSTRQNQKLGKQNLKFSKMLENLLRYWLNVSIILNVSFKLSKNKLTYVTSSQVLSAAIHYEWTKKYREVVIFFRSNLKLIQLYKQYMQKKIR